ncbi:MULTISPECIES: response regulator [Blautia]|uniref:response regulator n=1 Tax=Blautia TaxID=572511 RepID=UPI001D07FB50|nr:MULTISPECIES: response regulator [Blautia]MCB6730575.1 response regulator [Blautia obeum]MCB6741440.1 response regulator [Blautia sp. 210820-DFI.6.14]MCB6957896.1 response regulator [Blautia obeum]MCG4675117.1 response regulator [Blautia obeum]MDE8679335.1 response regulator [Blautia schinkii]
MTNVLIVDDEKIEREGLKYLLSREEGERNVFEASNGKQALQIIRSEDIQLVLTDIKMPHMDGLELSRRAKEENPALQIIIFSGYSDFTFAQEAIRYGVTEYILKPVNPEDFHKVIQKAEKVIEQRKKKESREIKGKNFLQQYFLQNYLYSGKLEILEKAKDMINLEKWNGWHCGILLESDVAFFDTAEETLEEEIQKELRRVCFYLNLNARQSLLLFQDVYCDYQLVANHLYNFMKRKYRDSFYLAVSRKFEGCECLPEILEQLEQQMEEKFYHPEKHVFSNVIQELFQENQFSGERRLEHEIERLYNCRNIMEIVEVTEDNIKEYEAFLDRSMSSSRNEVAAVKNYIYQHYEEDLNLEMLAEKVYLSSGYLSFIFKKETGMNLNRYIRVFRMEKAKELLCSTNMKVAQVSERVGFANVSYFCRSFREYYGSSPESYRKGTGEDEQTS